MVGRFQKLVGRLALAGIAFASGAAGVCAASTDDPAAWLLRGSSNLSAPIAVQEPKSASVASRPERVGADVRTALAAGDYTQASSLAARMLAVEGSPVWTAGPFARFAEAVFNVTDKVTEERLSGWAQHDPANPIPLLVRGLYYRDYGWLRRGKGFISTVSSEDQQAFSAAITKALTDIGRALEINPDNAYAHYQRLEILRTGGMTPAMASAFKDSIARYPEYAGLYDIVLNVLQPRWGGDIAAMHEFVEAFSGKAPEGSPLKLLEVDLYGRLLSTASISCANDEASADGKETCIRAFMAENAGADLEARAMKAMEMFGQLDRYETNSALESILTNMVDVRGGDVFAMPMVQAFSDAYRSDIRLRGDAYARSHYLAETLVARSWGNRGFPENALTKYKEALERLPFARFPNEQARNEAAADLHMSIAALYSAQSDYAATMTAARASLQLADRPYSGLLLCYSQFWLKDYEGAIGSCSNVTGDSDNGIFAHYWRGLAYKDTGQAGKALDDLAVVAGSTSSRRAGAAIEMSMIYFNRNDNKGALDLLNRYAFLYDPKVTNKSDVAVAYNNRCYALMELGDLKPALEDCNASLTYGNIPDAYAKRKVLLEKVASK